MKTHKIISGFKYLKCAFSSIISIIEIFHKDYIVCRMVAGGKDIYHNLTILS